LAYVGDSKDGMKQETFYRIGVLSLLICILTVQLITMNRIPLVRVKGTIDVDVQNSRLDVESSTPLEVEVQNPTPWEVQVVR
jgi:hypothetical protein